MAGRMIEVNTSTLKNDVSTIMGEINGLWRDIQALRDTASQLSTMWDGSAKAAFMAAVQDDIRRAEELVKALEKFAGKTDSSRAEYDKCENSVAGIVSSIRV